MGNETSKNGNMETTHGRRILRQCFNLWKQNWGVFLLAWGLAGVISLAASNAACSNIELGTFGTILLFILRTKSLEVICYLGLLLLTIGLILYLCNMPMKFRSIQRVFLQKVYSPSLFVIAGYLSGLPAFDMNQGQTLFALAKPVVLLIFATLLTSLYEIFEMGNF